MNYRAGKVIFKEVWILNLLMALSCFAESPSGSQELLQKLNAIPGQEGVEIRYGYDVFTSTAKYFGPRGTIFRGTKSRVSCSQCHMESGNKVMGNSLLDTHGSYPQFRYRENEIQTVPARINACFRHPLLGTKNIPETSREMKAMQLYIKWLGRGRVVLEKDMDGRLPKLAFLARAADPDLGKPIYEKNCSQCHGLDGQGKIVSDGSHFEYPPLWGKESFMKGSSMSRLSVLARFIFGNMPYGASADSPKMLEQDSWDVAGFILSQKRPAWIGKPPFSNLKQKPFDYPIGPFSDRFSDLQHQMGPYAPIIDFYGGPSVVQSGSGI